MGSGYLSLVVATVSLLVSFATLFFVHLRPARIEAHVGPNLDCGYDEDGGVFFSVPCSFLNLASTSGVVVRCGLFVARDTEQSGYFMRWDDFVRYDEDEEEWTFDGDSRALTVLGKADVHEIIWFVWPDSKLPKLRLNQGYYQLSLFWWEHGRKAPKRKSYRFELTADDAGALEKKRAAVNEDVHTIFLDESTRVGIEYIPVDDPRLK